MLRKAPNAFTKHTQYLVDAQECLHPLVKNDVFFMLSDLTVTEYECLRRTAPRKKYTFSSFRLSCRDEC